MTWTFTLSNATTLRVTSTARNGTTNVVFTTNLTVSAAPDAIQFYATNMSAGDNRQPYFNNLQISQGDATPPTVTISNQLVALAVGTAYSPSAASATDNVDGDVSASITNDSATVLTSSVLNTPGTYTVTYSAKDAANNTGTATQTVVVHPVGTFASQYALVTAPGIFNGWKADGSGNNALIKTANFRWRLLYYFPAAANTDYLIIGNTNYSPKWGAGGVRGAENANLSPTVNTNGWYSFELNELTDTASLSKFTSTTDVDTDGIPDEWEQHYGAQLSPPVTNLDPNTVYNEELGGTRTAKQAFDQGANPIRDGNPPTLAFASGITAWSVVAVGANSGQIVPVAADVVATGDSPSETLTSVVLLNQLKGSNPGVYDAIDTTVDGLWKADYTFTDPTGNRASLSRVVVVGSPEPGWRKLMGPATNTISTTGSVTIYGQVWIDGATPGAGQVPNISAEYAVNATNTDPATWDAGAWKTASFNAGSTGGDDEYQGTINGSELTAGTYYYAFRFKVGDSAGVWRYAGVNAAGTDGGPWDGTINGNGTLVVNQAQTRNVTFAVDMRVQQFKNAFVSGEKVVVSGAFNGWGTNNELTLDSGSGLHKATINIEGLEGATNEFKFRVLGTTRTNAGMEYESVSNRALVLGAAGAATNLPTAFFNNLEESRKLTLRVDMTTQIAKGNFNASSNSVYVAGNFNGFSTTANLAAPAPGVGANVYSATLFLDGPQTGNAEYKFFNSAGAPNSGYEIARENANRVITVAQLGANLSEYTNSPIPLFSNDDGVGPTLSLNGSATVNLAVGDTFSDPGATATDLLDGTCTVEVAGGPVSTAAPGTYTLTYTTFDVAGNASVPASVTRTVVVAASADPLADYLGGFGLTGANAAGNADPDGDGMDNNAELAFGTDPTNGASRAATLATGTGTIKLVYLQRNTGVTYTVKSFTDLSTPFDSGGTAVTPTATDPQPVGIRAGYTQYEASLSTGSTRGFLRVKAVR